VTAVQKGAVDVIALATGVILAPAEAWTRMLAAMQSNSELREELLRLEQENRVLKGRTQRLASVLAENARYRALLNSARDVEEQLIAAKIIAISPDPARHVVVIDKGSQDGIEQGQAVLGEEGLMGQIVLSGDFSSRAVLITDSAHALPVQVNRSGLRAIAEGSGALDRLLIRHLPASADIRVGDLLVTSGLGGRFPSGYPVARVTQVESPAGEAFALVTAEPTSALDRGRFVLVLQGSVRDEGES
jgi:rod shape-determining protein MreC